MEESCKGINVVEVDDKNTQLNKLARTILSIDEKASLQDIKKAFWMKAMVTHPDRNPKDKEAEKKFNNLVNAYEFLTKGKEYSIDFNTKNDNIGQYLATTWGYFCWWKDNYF